MILFRRKCPKCRKGQLVKKKNIGRALRMKVLACSSDYCDYKEVKVKK